MSYPADRLHPMEPISAPAPGLEQISPANPAHDDARLQAEDTSSQALGEEICGLASRISTATARLIFLVAEFDARQAWSGFGVKSCAHWLSWKCHIGTHAAREQVRVARALRELPLLRAEFGAGRLSYGKVRSLTRIATPDCESDLVDLGLSGTAAHVERTVAAWRRVDTLAEPDRAAKRALSWHFDDDGMLVVSARLDSEEGAQLLAAIAAVQAREAASTNAASQTAAAAAMPDDPVPNDPTPDQTSPGEPVPHEPAAHEPMASGEHPISATPVGVPALDALLGLARAYLNGDHDTGRDPDVDLVIELDAAVLQRDLAAGRACFESGGSLTAEQARRLACDSKLMLILKDGPDVLDVGRTRTIPAALRRALTARDRGCAVPGCTERRPRRLHAHHVRHWADGGPTCLDNLVLLCKAHHYSIHHNGVTVTSTGIGRFDFSAPNGTILQPIPALAGAPIAASTDPVVAFDDQLSAPTAIAPSWQGEPLDLDYVLTTLMARRNQRSHQRARGHEQTRAHDQKQAA
jgi:hypothetical protein